MKYFDKDIINLLKYWQMKMYMMHVKMIFLHCHYFI